MASAEIALVCFEGLGGCQDNVCVNSDAGEILA